VLTRTRIALLSLASLLTFVTLCMVAPTPAFADECTPQELQTGGCNVEGSLGDGGATLEGSTGSPGTPGGDSGSGPGVSDGEPESCVPVLDDRCLGWGPGRTEPTEPTAPITLADVAHFRPDPGVDVMEPDGWMVVGLDTNFFAHSGVQVHTGTLLGQSASVRFTPVAWHWTYGDGASHSAATPGAPWAALGAREFDPTATSHVYAAAGTYVIDLTIDFAVEYRFGAGAWVDIAGVLPVPANRLVATAGSAKTVLVERECTVHPAGPGC